MIQDGIFLKTHIENLTKRDAKQFVDSVISECAITRDTFNNWLYCKCRIRQLYKTKIEELAKYAIFSVDNLTTNDTKEP